MAEPTPREQALNEIQKATKMLGVSLDAEEKHRGDAATLAVGRAHVSATRAVAHALLDVADAIRGRS